MITYGQHVCKYDNNNHMIRIPENISRVTKTTSGEKKETKSCFLNNDGRLLSGSNPKKLTNIF